MELLKCEVCGSHIRVPENSDRVTCTSCGSIYQRSSPANPSPSPARILVTKEWIEENVAPLFGLTSDDPRFDTRYDINGDGVIDIYDLTWFSTHLGKWITVTGGLEFLITKEWIDANVAPRFGQRRGDPLYHAGIDLNRDGVIDIYDVTAWSTKIGTTVYVPDVAGLLLIKLYKMPWVSWETVANKFTTRLEEELRAKGYGDILIDYPIEIRKGAWGSSELVMTVYASPIAATAIILGICLLLTIGYCIFLQWSLIEKGRVLRDVSNILTTVKGQLDETEDEIERLYAEGAITLESRGRLLGMIGEAKEGVIEAEEKARKAGEPENWMHFFAEVVKWVPTVLAVSLAVVVIGSVASLLKR